MPNLLSAWARCAGAQTDAVFSGPAGWSGIEPVWRSMNFSNNSHTADLPKSCILVELLLKTEWEMSGVGEMGVMEEGSKAGSAEGWAQCCSSGTGWSEPQWPAKGQMWAHKGGRQSHCHGQLWFQCCSYFPGMSWPCLCPCACSGPVWSCGWFHTSDFLGSDCMICSILSAWVLLGAVFASW